LDFETLKQKHSYTPLEYAQYSRMLRLEARLAWTLKGDSAKVLQLVWDHELKANSADNDYIAAALEVANSPTMPLDQKRGIVLDLLKQWAFEQQSMLEASRGAVTASENIECIFLPKLMSEQRASERHVMRWLGMDPSIGID